MIYILFALLFLLTYYAYCRLDRDIFFPAVVKIAMFLLSTFVALLNSNEWGIDITLTTIIVVTSGLLVFALSSIMAKIIYSSNKSNNTKKKLPIREILGTKRVFYVISITYMIVNLLLYYSYILNASLSFGGDNNIFTMLGFYRDASVSSQIQDPAYLVFMNLGSSCLSALFSIIFINNIINGKRQIKYILPLIIHSAIITMSSSRIGFIYLIGFLLITYYLLSVRQKRKIKNKKIIKRASLSLAIFLILFIQLGSLTGKSQSYETPYQNISIYMGSSIYALDSFLNNYSYNINNFGSETIYGINNLVNRINTNSTNDNSNSRFLDFVYIGDMPKRTNIYTSYRRLIHDYGYIGLFIIELLSGYFITRVYLKLRNNQYTNFYFALMIYVFFFQSILLSSIEEKLIVNLPTISTAVTFILYWILSKYILKSTPIYSNPEIKVRNAS